MRKIDLSGVLRKQLKDGKAVIVEAVVNKGGTASTTNTFTELASSINDISTGGNLIGGFVLVNIQGRVMSNLIKGVVTV